jgi:hypothetical protein
MKEAAVAEDVDPAVVGAALGAAGTLLVGLLGGGLAWLADRRNARSENERQRREVSRSAYARLYLAALTFRDFAEARVVIASRHPTSTSSTATGSTGRGPTGPTTRRTRQPCW